MIYGSQVEAAANQSTSQKSAQIAGCNFFSLDKTLTKEYSNPQVSSRPPQSSGEQIHSFAPEAKNTKKHPF
jgi:hypothetical protein